MRTNAQVIEWLKTVSDRRLHQLAHLIWKEGMRRGWNQYWMD